MQKMPALCKLSYCREVHASSGAELVIEVAVCQQRPGAKGQCYSRMGGSFADEQDGHEVGFKPLDVKDKNYETISNIFNQGFLRVCGVVTSDVCLTCLVPPVRSFFPHFWLK
jgi:hypothetical protein